MKKFFLLLAFLLAFPSAFCQESPASAIAFGIREIKTLDMYFGYLPYISKNTWGYVTLNFTPVDGVSRIVVANIRIVEEQSASSTIEIMVNETPCKTSSITSYLTGKTQYVADFDCTNVINSSGIYVVGLRPSEIIYNVHFRIWITYENNPEEQINQTLNYIVDNIDEVKMLLFDAVETKKYCVNNSLYIEKLANITLGNKTYPYIKTEVVECEFGCDEERKECNFPTWIYYSILVCVIIALFVIVKYVVLRI
ncbi:MAG: hypothetical protein ABIK75_07100 [candidate division WOR-3 bacterium]